MPRVLSGSDQLRNLFAAVTEQTFQVEFGVADPPLIDYLSDMLVRFTRVDVIFKVRDVVGRRLEEVAEMMMEAEQCTSKPKAEIHRHIGDFTLFWTGVYPEGLKRLKALDRKDAMIDYQAQGKRSYYLASQLSGEPEEPRSGVLRRLSQEFELCSEGLRKVREEWEMLPRTGCS
ncbi:hypothetical protein KOR42_09500 [Thalassoglobus neptunius]|uniref:Uncharacterized protein n=1 Tax=Thalassoglobus neptunius TaxID=1938619 RepID=A0A5C5X4D6_9PLAN|nr:hypothetical protein [Thalassoglobus neptunius]TWT57588.1 hypothetical protein KOR42_09500 [Thalassoglobus neptunius]